MCSTFHGFMCDENWHLNGHKINQLYTVLCLRSNHVYQSRDALIQPFSLLHTGSSISSRGIYRYWSDTYKICVIGIFFFFFNLTWGRTSLSHWRLLAAQHHLLNVAGSRRHAQRNVFRADSYSNLIRVQMRVRTFFMIDYKSTMTEHEMSVYLRDDCANSSSTQRTCYLTNESSIILYSTSCWLKIRWKFSNQRNISQVSQPNGLEGSLWDHILIWKDVIHTLVAWSSLFGHFRMHANVISLAGTVKISVFVKKKKRCVINIFTNRFGISEHLANQITLDEL